MFLSILLLIVGMFCLIKGADLFVDGASIIAKRLHIPSLIIGLTLVSIGTSLPEFSVSLTSAIQGLNDMSFGNIVGSNIFNTFVVIGVSAIITPLVISKDMYKYDLPILIGIYFLLIIFCFIISPYTLSLIESIIIFSLFFIYTIFLIFRSKKEIAKEEINQSTLSPLWKNILFVVLGLAGIILGGNLVVDNASTIAKELGMSETLVGLTIVAVGTSLPELVTSIVAAKKGENDIAVGNAVGSSIFNVILILGFCSTIRSINVNISSLVDVIIMLISALLLFAFALKGKKVNKVQGLILVIIYIAYLTYIICRNYALI